MSISCFLWFLGHLNVGSPVLGHLVSCDLQKTADFHLLCQVNCPHWNALDCTLQVTLLKENVIQTCSPRLWTSQTRLMLTDLNVCLMIPAPGIGWKNSGCLVRLLQQHLVAFWQRNANWDFSLPWNSWPCPWTIFPQFSQFAGQSCKLSQCWNR